MLPQLVDDRFQVFSLPLPGYFSPFPHGTSSLSVVGEYLALEDGPPRFPRGFTCPAVLRYRLRCCSTSGTGLSPSVTRLSRRFPCLLTDRLLTALQPRRDESRRFRLFPVRSPLLRESRLISSPAGTEMFHFPAFASNLLYIQRMDDLDLPSRVSPFGNLRVTGF